MLPILLLLLGSALAAPKYDSEVPLNDVGAPQTLEQTLLVKLNARCSRRDTTACFMLKVFTEVNRLLKKSSIGLGESLVITQTAVVQEEESPMSRSLQDASEEEQLAALVANKLWNFARSRSIKWSVLPEADLVMSATPDDEGTLKLGMNIRAGRALQETGRGKMKNMGPVIAAGIMKIGMVGMLAFKALALLVGKALLVSKLAFLLAAIIGLKKLFSQERHVTYEVVAHPHHTHSEVHSGGGHHEVASSGWGRNLEVSPQASGDPQTLVYSAHTP